MQEFSCQKCHQVVEANQTPHSCPRCYSPASEAYQDPRDSLDHMFEEVSEEAEDDLVGGEWLKNLKTLELEEEDLKPAREEELPVAEAPAAEAPLVVASQNVEQRAERVEQLRVDKTGPFTPQGPPVAPRPDATGPRFPTSSQRRDDATGPFVIEELRRSDGTGPHLPLRLRRPSRRGVPPTQEAPRLDETQQRPRRPTRRTQRLPTSQTDRLMDSVKQDRRKRRTGLWVFGVLLVGGGIGAHFTLNELGPSTKTAPTGDPVDRLVRSSKKAAPAAQQPAQTVPDAAVVADYSNLAGRSEDAALGGEGGVRPTSSRDKRLDDKTSSRRRPGSRTPGHRRGNKVARKPKRAPVKKPAPGASVVAKASPAPPSTSTPPPSTESAASLYRKGLKALMSGQTQGAIDLLSQAVKKRRGMASAYRGLGLAYQKRGDKAQARAAFSRYLELSPNAIDAMAIRRRLDQLK